jgi:hypothetical protein
MTPTSQTSSLVNSRLASSTACTLKKFRKDYTMATFSISMSVEVEADSYEAAMEIERSLHEFIQGHDEALGVYGIDVEQTSDLEADEE